eukprot:s6800_g1.t1
MRRVTAATWLSVWLSVSQLQCYQANELAIGVLMPLAWTQTQIATTVCFDLDVRKNFEPAIRARFGEPIVTIPDLHPGVANVTIRMGTTDMQPEVGVATAIDFMLGLDGERPIAGLDGPEVTQATSIRFLETTDGPVLVVTSTNGTQIYSEDATALIFYLPVTDAASPDSLRYHQAACFGTLWPVSAVAAGQYVQLHESAPSSPTGEVADLCFSPLADAVVSVHTNGDLRVWSVSADQPYTNTEVIPSIAQAGPLGEV